MNTREKRLDNFEKLVEKKTSSFLYNMNLIKTKREVIKNHYSEIKKFFIENEDKDEVEYYNKDIGSIIIKRKDLS